MISGMVSLSIFTVWYLLIGQLFLLSQVGILLFGKGLPGVNWSVGLYFKAQGGLLGLCFEHSPFGIAPLGVRCQLLITEGRAFLTLAW